MTSISRFLERLPKTANHGRLSLVETRCPYLVGRDGELARLRALLAATRVGTGGAVVVSGEPGVGKSRLVQELAEQARLLPATVLAGRAVASSVDVAYRPLAELLAQAARDRDLTHDPDLQPWLPALQVMLPALGGPAADGVEATAHVCGEALIHVFRHVGAGRPLVVVFEDLQWADPDTLAIVEYLADNLATEPVLCIGTLRDEQSGPALELVRRLDQRGAASQLELHRLADADVAEMVAACVPDAGVELVSRVQGTAEGVPLLVEEMLATPGVPASVGEAVRTRVADLDDDERAVLYAAAVLGRDFDWQVLPELTGRPVEQVTSALERMVALMLINVDGDGFRFRHALIKDAVVAMLVPPRRVAIARAALAVVDTSRSNPDHADLALQAGEVARAGVLLAESGREALRRGALNTAVQTMQRAVPLLDDPTDGQLALVEALGLAGRFDDALEVGAQLLERLGADHPMAAAVHLGLASAAVTATRWPQASTHLASARAVLAQHPDPRQVEQADVLEAEVALADDALDQARAAAYRALAAAEAAGSSQTICHALELIGRSHRVYDLDTAREAFTRAYDSAEAAGLPVRRLRALHELGTIELFDRAGSDTLLSARDIAKQLGVHSTAAVLDVQLAAAYHLQFDLDAAHLHAHRAVARSRRLGLTGTYAVAKFFDAGTSALRGDRKATATATAEVLRAAPDNREIEGYVWAGATGLLELFWGDRATAVAALDRGMDALHTVARSSPGHYRGLWALLHAVQHDSGVCERMERVQESGSTVMRPNAGYLHYARAVIDHSPRAVLAGDADLAFVPVWHQLGRMLVAEAALSDGWGTPRLWLQEARRCFEAYGLDHLERRCARLLGATPRKVPEGLTAREPEVFDLVAEGLANKQIAGRLQLSVRTVEKHVESLLRKTGARSRAQLIAMRGTESG